MDTLITALAGATAALLGGLIPLLREWLSTYVDSSSFRRLPGPVQSVLLALRSEGPAGRVAAGRSYAERMHELTGSLSRTSDEFDSLLAEMRVAADQRATAVSEMEASLAELTAREEALRSRIVTLNAVQPEAAREFVELLRQQQVVSERRSAKRDYLLFVLGIAVGLVAQVVFTLLFGGG